MICTWFPACWAKNRKWRSKELILGRQKILSNCVEFGLKMIAATRRLPFIQYMPWFVHDFPRCWPITQNGLPRSPFLADKKFAPTEATLGLKWSRERVDHDSYNICNVLYMISNFSGQKPKMALEKANFGPSKNSLKSRRVWAQNDRGNA